MSETLSDVSKSLVPTAKQRRSTDGVYICVGNVAGEERKHSVYVKVLRAFSPCSSHSLQVHFLRV